jgi:hypothetical protein
MPLPPARGPAVNLHRSWLNSAPRRRPAEAESGLDAEGLAMLRAALLGEPSPRRAESAGLVASAASIGRQAAAIGSRPRGVFPDGSRVPGEFKRAVLDVWQDERDAWYGMPAPRQPVLNSAQLGGVSPLIERIYGAD